MPASRTTRIPSPPPIRCNGFSKFPRTLCSCRRYEITKLAGRDDLPVFSVLWVWAFARLIASGGHSTCRRQRGCVPSVVFFMQKGTLYGVPIMRTTVSPKQSDIPIALSIPFPPRKAWHHRVVQLIFQSNYHFIHSRFATGEQAANI